MNIATKVYPSFLVLYRIRLFSWFYIRWDHGLKARRQATGVICLTNDVADAMTKAGVENLCARVLMYVIEKKSCRAIDAEMDLRLRQPDVSMAVRLLESKRWVRRVSIQHGKMGRPHYNIMPAKSSSEIYNEIEAAEKKRVEDIMKNLEVLKDYLDPYSEDTMDTDVLKGQLISDEASDR